MSAGAVNHQEESAGVQENSPGQLAGKKQLSIPPLVFQIYFLGAQN